MAKVPYPLATAFMTRDGTLGAKDPFVQNAYLDKYGEKSFVIKRPGTIQFFDFGVSTESQGAFFFNGLIYAVYGDTLYRTGGAANIGADGAAWTQAPTPSWYGRSFFTATVFKNRIYVIGGEASFLYADVSYTDDGVLWSQNASAAPFSHRQGHGACVFNDQMWLMGGQQVDSTVNQVMNDVWSTTDGANWTLVTASAAWSARVNFSLLAANNGMYIYGGEDAGGNMLDDVWYSTDGATWTNLTMAATGTGRGVATFLFFNNDLWIIGGDAAPIPGGSPINDVSSSPNGQIWAVTAPVFPAGRADMSGVVYNNKMWLIAGVSGAALTSEVYSSTNGTTWTLVTVATGFTARAACQAVVFKTPSSVNTFRYDTMWLLGGNDGATDLQDVWRANLDAPLNTSYALSPDISGQSYQFNTFENGTKLLIKNESNFWVLESGTLTKVTDTNYPAVTVPGIVVLNSFAYIMTPEGEIRACAIDNPLLWPSLQFIFADYEDDPGVAIAKYLNYLVAFGTYTTQFFYDAGNPAPGIALSPYQSASCKVGCANAATVQTIKNTLIWVGQTSQRDWGVYVFDGLSPKKISTSWVDKAINDGLGGASTTWVTGMEGHTFYIIRLSVDIASLAYDMDTNQWSIWLGPADAAVPYKFGLTTFSFGGDVWVGSGTLAGKLYTAGLGFYDDAGSAFDVVVQTDNLDAQTLERKFCGRLDFVSDIGPGNVLVEVTDDDYNTYTTWGTVDLSLSRPYLNRGGSFRRRAFRLTQSDSNPVRWERIDLTMSAGES